MQNKLPDSGLNNVTRSLAINLYQLWDVRHNETVGSWFESLEQQFSAERLSIFVTKLSSGIGTRILSISSTPYEPYGASVALLVGQEQHFLAHLDASHIAAHSYFEASEHFGQFRLEIEISTCGTEHPQILIAEVLKETSADFVQLDYRARGLVWNSNGEPHLASEALDSDFFRFDGYQTDIQRNTRRGGCYVELTRTNLDSTISKAIKQMRK